MLTQSVFLKDVPSVLPRGPSIPAPPPQPQHEATGAVVAQHLIKIKPLWVWGINERETELSE